MKAAQAAAAALALALVLAAGPAFAYQGPAPYTTREGVLMLPIRWAAEANKAEVVPGGDGAVAVIARRVEPAVYDDLGFLVRPGRTLERITVFKVGSDRAVIRGVEIRMPAKAEIREGRLFVPAQFALLATRAE